ncbi:MAG: hypothetical protein AAFY34_12245, partial [Pseudomonadota bacterium]
MKQIVHRWPSDGTAATIIRVENTHKIEPVYNFEVDGWHTYFVGHLGTWVHNTNCRAPERLLPGELNVGKAGTLTEAGRRGDNIEAHHIPSAKRVQLEGVSAGDGIAINVERIRHIST